MNKLTAIVFAGITFILAAAEPAPLFTSKELVRPSGDKGVTPVVTDGVARVEAGDFRNAGVCTPRIPCSAGRYLITFEARGNGNLIVSLFGQGFKRIDPFRQWQRLDGNWRSFSAEVELPENTAALVCSVYYWEQQGKWFEVRNLVFKPLQSAAQDSVKPLQSAAQDSVKPLFTSKELVRPAGDKGVTPVVTNGVARVEAGDFRNAGVCTPRIPCSAGRYLLTFEARGNGNLIVSLFGEGFKRIDPFKQWQRLDGNWRSFSAEVELPETATALVAQTYYWEQQGKWFEVRNLVFKPAALK